MQLYNRFVPTGYVCNEYYQPPGQANNSAQAPARFLTIKEFAQRFNCIIFHYVDTGTQYENATCYTLLRLRKASLCPCIAELCR